MKSLGVCFAAVSALSCLLLGAGCGEQQAASTGASSATPQKGDVAASATATASVAPPVASSAPATTASAATNAAAVDSAAAASASGAPSAAPASSSSAAAPAASGSAAAGAKTFDCGAKGQKLCPMQGWMKGVMGNAASSNDAKKLADALAYTAAKPPPGMGQWVAISNDGVAKAKAGDIDGAKVSCKKCHDLYKEKYKNTMRDKPW